MLEERVARLIRTIPDFPKKGVEFKDVTPIMLDVPLMAEMVESFVDAGRETGVNAVIGIESRGFFFGPLIAYRLAVPFLVVRKRGSFPGVTSTFSTYDLEYGSSSIEMNINDLPDNARVMIHDDLLATGVTATAAANLLRHAGAEVAMFSFVGHLVFLGGAEKLLTFSPNIFTLAEL